MMWKIESPKSCRLRSVFISHCFCNGFGNRVIRRWRPQFWNSFDIKSQRQLRTQLPTQLGRTVDIPTQNTAPPALPPPAGAVGGFTSDWEPERAWCVPHLGLSQTYPLNPQSQSPRQHQLEFGMLFLALDPITQRSSENQLQFLSSILLCLWKYCKTTHLNILREQKWLNASRKENTL